MTGESSPLWVLHRPDHHRLHLATGPEQEVESITAVVSGHIGTQGIVQRGNQVWIDTLETLGEPTLVTVRDLLTLAGNEPL